MWCFCIKSQQAAVWLSCLLVCCKKKINKLMGIQQHTPWITIAHICRSVLFWTLPTVTACTCGLNSPVPPANWNCGAPSWCERGWCVQNARVTQCPRPIAAAVTASRAPGEPCFLTKDRPWRPHLLITCLQISCKGGKCPNMILQDKSFHGQSEHS